MVDNLLFREQPNKFKPILSTLEKVYKKDRYNLQPRLMNSDLG